MLIISQSLRDVNSLFIVFQKLIIKAISMATTNANYVEAFVNLVTKYTIQHIFWWY